MRRFVLLGLLHSMALNLPLLCHLGPLGPPELAVARVLQAAQAAGIARIGFVTEPPARRD